MRIEEKKPGVAGEKELAITRRTFLTSVQGAIAVVALGGVVRALSRNDLLRPPGGQHGATFSARCIRCDRCRSVCPTDVIGVAQFENGILNTRTPIMKFHLGYCNFCKKCVDVCPTQALEDFDPKDIKIGVARITPRCIAWNTGGCTICRGACTYQAIRLDEWKRPVVDENRCNGCGRCEKACPALALQSYSGGALRGIEVRTLNNGGSQS